MDSLTRGIEKTQPADCVKMIWISIEGLDSSWSFKNKLNKDGNPFARLVIIHQDSNLTCLTAKGHHCHDLRIQNCMQDCH